jgi:hypothetical protein
VGSTGDELGTNSPRLTAGFLAAALATVVLVLAGCGAEDAPASFPISHQYIFNKGAGNAVFVIDRNGGDRQYFVVPPGTGGLALETRDGGLQIGVANAACGPTQQQAIGVDRDALFVIEETGQLYMWDGVEADAILQQIDGHRLVPGKCPG